MSEKIDVSIEPAELVSMLRDLGWAIRGFADMIGVPERRVRRGQLSQEVLAVLRGRVAHAHANPFPVEDRVRREEALARLAASRRGKHDRGAAAALNHRA